MDDANAVKSATPLVVAIIVLAAIVAAAAVLRARVFAPAPGEGLGASAPPAPADPKLPRYRQVAELPLTLKSPRAIAAGQYDNIYVAGDRQVAVYSADGNKVLQFATEEEPRCLSAGRRSPELLYVGMKDHVEVFSPAGKRLARWESRGGGAQLTSIAATDADVWVADAGARAVLRYDLAGKLLGTIGGRDPQRGLTGFVVPSPYFDLAVDPDGLLRVVNPGNHRIETYTHDGKLQGAWGKAGTALEGFSGCCNPAHIAILPDGRFVTSEKGTPRIKVYGGDGRLAALVAGSDDLSPAITETHPDAVPQEHAVFDVAADCRGRVLVLDPLRRSVRVFEPPENKDNDPAPPSAAQTR